MPTCACVLGSRWECCEQHLDCDPRLACASISHATRASAPLGLGVVVFWQCDGRLATSTQKGRVRHTVATCYGTEQAPFQARVYVLHCDKCKADHALSYWCVST